MSQISPVSLGRRTFGIKTLFGATVVVAAGIAVATGEKSRFQNWFIPPVVIWLAISLNDQAARLWRELRAAAGNYSREQRSGRRLEIVWRIAAAAILFATVLLESLRARNNLGAPKWQVMEFSPDTIERGIQLLCAAFVIGSGSWRPATNSTRGVESPLVRAGKSSWRFIWNSIVWLSIGILMIVVLGEAGVIRALVHIAVRGIELGDTRWQLSIEEKQNGYWWLEYFSWLSLAAALASIANLVLLRRILGSVYERRARCWLLAPFACSVAATIAFPIWARAIGFRLVSPALGEAPSEAPVHAWIEIVFLIAIAAFAVVYSSFRRAEHRSRVVRGETLAGNASRLSFHETRWAAGLLAIALSIAILYPPIHSVSGGVWNLTMLDLMALAYGPEAQLHLAIVVAAVAAIFRQHQPEQRLATSPPLETTALRFLGAWLFSATAVIAALACLAIFAFGMWLSPMMRW